MDPIGRVGYTYGEGVEPPVIRVVAAWTTDTDDRILLVRKRGSGIFMQPGGKPEPEETPEQALVRELREEVGVVVEESALDPWGRYRTDAANEPGHLLIAEVFGVPIEQPVHAAAEIEEARWFTAPEAAALGDRLAPLARRMLGFAGIRGRPRPFELATPVDTARLRLRRFVPADADAVWAYHSRDDVCRYLLHEPWTRAEVAERVTTYAGQRRLAAAGDCLQIAVERREDGRLIGDLDFTLASAEHLTAEIGWTFHPDSHGQGYATEAAAALLPIAFDRMGLHRVVAELDARNRRSNGVCVRLGMRQEGDRLADWWAKGEWTDTLQFAILADEWRARRRQ